MAKNYFKESVRANLTAYREIYNELHDIALSVISWENLPGELTSGYMERVLFENNRGFFFYDDVLNVPLFMPGTEIGGLNVYGNPIHIHADSMYSSYRTYVRNGDFVTIWNNQNRSNAHGYIDMMARRIANLDRIIDVNANVQKTPGFITCDKDQRLTLLNLWKEYDGNAPVVFANKSIDLDNLKYIATGAPYLADKLYDLRSRYYNAALSYLGIPNVQVQKKERLISDEVNRAQGGALANRFSRMSAREEAVEKINAKFGLDIKVKFRDFEGKEGTEGGAQNVTVYDND